MENKVFFYENYMKKSNKFLLLFLLICLLWGFLKVYQYKTDSRIFPLFEEKQYEEIVASKGFSQNAPVLHNLWNTEVMLYIENTHVKHLENALEYFSGSLNLEENEFTRHNYELVEKMLQKTNEVDQEKQSKKKEDENQQTKADDTPSDGGENQNEERENKNQEAQWWEEMWVHEWKETSSWEAKNNLEDSEDGNIQNPDRPDEYILRDSEQSALSEEEQQLLEEKKEILKQEQIYNQKYYGKHTKQTDLFWNFESFFWNNQRTQEKDW